MSGIDAQVVLNLSTLSGALGSLTAPEIADPVVDQYLGIPGLRGFWGMASYDENGNAMDFSGQNRTLGYNGNPLYDSAGLATFITLDGTGDYLDRADEAGLDIIGTEAHITNPGLFACTWVRFANAAGANESILTKRSVAANTAAYGMSRGAAGLLNAVIGTGAASETVSSVATLNQNQWHFTAMRWTPSTDLCVWVDQEKTCAGASAIAALNNNAFRFMIGAYDNGAGVGTVLMTGDVGCAALAAQSPTDAQVMNLYNRSRAAFGI